MYIFLFVAAILIGYSLIYFNQYHIKDDRTAFQSSLTIGLNEGSESIELDMNEIVQLDDTSSYIGLFQTQNSHVGYAHFIKGWNGKI